MAKSNYVFENGIAVDVGDAGQNDIAFVSGDSLTDNGESSFVFENGNAIRGDVIEFLEDFEDPFDIDEYVGSGKDAFSRVTSPVEQGTFAGKIDPTLQSDGDPFMLTTGSQIQEDRQYRGYVRFAEEDRAIGLLFMTQGTTTDTLGDPAPVGYQVNLEDSDQTFEVGVQDGTTASGGSKTFATTSLSFNAGIWYQIDFFKSGNQVNVALRDEDGNIIGDINGTDDTYSSGGFGWQVSATERPPDGGTGFFDSIRQVQT